jgi:hypothetical protein
MLVDVFDQSSSYNGLMKESLASIGTGVNQVSVVYDDMVGGTPMTLHFQVRNVSQPVLEFIFDVGGDSVAAVGNLHCANHDLSCASDNFLYLPREGNPLIQS